MTFNKKGYKLSVITPVYNGKTFIESCIKNVADQNCPDVEHIIVDGGSTDGTVEIIKRYATQYGHIRWVSKRDRGQSDAMNEGIRMATGHIIGFLNVDDYHEPEVLNWVIERFVNLPEPAFLVGNCNVWGDDGKVQWVNKPAHLSLTKLLVADESRYPFPVNPSAYFYHKSIHDLIQFYNIEDHYTLDIDFILRALPYSNCTYVDKTLGNYRYIAGTKTHNDSYNGAGDARFKRLIGKFRTQLPWSHRLYIKCVLTWAKLLQIFGG